MQSPMIPTMRPDFSVSPMIVIWEATRSCDLACKHCRAEAQPEAVPDELTDHEARAMIDRVHSAFGSPLFVITGGDPLKRRGLAGMVTHAASLGLEVGLTPSATPLLTPEAVDRLHAAGLRRLAISIDGADAATHDEFRGVSGTFARSIAILEHARSRGLEIQINSSIGTHNRHQLHQLAALARFLGVSLWSVFVMVPTGRAVGADLVPTALEHERTYHDLAAIALDPANTITIKTTAGQPYYRVLEQERRRRGVLPAARRGLGVNDGNGFLFIDHCGVICPSGFLPLPCGNVRHDDLATVYRTHPTFVGLRTPERFAGKCGRCPFQRICGGSRSRTYALTGDACGSDPTCVYVPPALSTAAAG